MKTIIQSEAAECGLACLAMVASHHDKHIGLVELRRLCPVSIKGARLGHLISIAQKIGFHARPLRVDLEHIDKVQTPCVLHWDFDHFVVLSRVGRTTVTIFDPARGERKLSIREASEHFTGVALELTPSHEFKPQKAEPSFSASQLMGRVRGLWPALAQVVVLSLALQLFVIVAPFFMQWVVDQVLVSGDQDLLVILGIGFGLALLLQTAIGVLRGWSVVNLSTRLGLQWTGNVFAHLLRLPLEYFERRQLGDVVSRMSSIRTIQQTLTTSFVEVIIDGMMALITFVLMIVYSWRLALVTMMAVALYFVIRWLAYRPLRDGTERQLVASASQQSHLLETLRGIQSLKVVGGESGRRAAFENLMTGTVNQDVRLARMEIGFSGSSQLIFGLERLAVIWMGSMLALNGTFSVGMLVAYLAYKDLFAQRVSGLIDRGVEFRMLRLHAERLSDIVMTPPEDEGDSAERPAPTNARIEFEQVYFRYGHEEPWVVQDCSFAIEAGESVAIVGASGCGKTTLVKLMLGLLKPTHGTIRVGGCKLDAASAKSIRSIVGAVMQDDRLFSGNIAQNISFFDDVGNQEAVELAASFAAIHDEIAAMPMGYHSLIGDMGSSLSGGQKQRVILARALYRNPMLLFLDEATSHLDVNNERAVNEAVRSLRLTKVIVAHRQETIATADRVLTMKDGRLVGGDGPKKCNSSAVMEAQAV